MTHTAHGRTFRKGVAQVLTNASDILYYQQQADFAVVILDDDPPAKVKAALKAPEPDADDEGEEPDADDEGDEDEDEDEGDAKPKLPGSKPMKPAKHKGK